MKREKPSFREIANYYGYKKEQYYSVRSDIMEYRRKVVYYVGSAGAVILSALFFSSFVITFLGEYRWISCSFSILAAACAVLSKASFAGNAWVLALSYVETIITVALSILLGPVSDPHILSTTFLMVLLLQPVLFLPTRRSSDLSFSSTGRSDSCRF